VQSRYPRPIAPKEPGTGATSPEAALLGTPASVSCITKSHSMLPASSPSRAPAPTTSMLVVPCEAPPAPDIPSTGSTHAFDVGPSDARGLTGATATAVSLGRPWLGPHFQS
jgi:hypothetical protein